MTTTTTSSSSTTSKMSLKLLVDIKVDRVLFAEASKDFVDFLFNLHRLPIGAVTNLLTKTNMVGSLGKLYESIENLSSTYLLQQSQDKDMLLKPTTLIPPGFLLLPNFKGNSEVYEPPKLYRCSWGSRCSNYVTLVVNTLCPNCDRLMNDSVTYAGKKKMELKGSGGEDGFVKEAVTYTIMDDLVVLPTSPISCHASLNKFNIKDISSIQEMVVEFGIQEAIQLLEASLQSRNVLTSVFLKDIKFKKESNMILQ
ncbi:uncharacterized protein LOC129292198 [Prosopis cineraria]|uniref:uncharacterized protein LOC129292198 n=1 Tax=Prosopis cineraria TaxID=364024 RepID=UPI00240F4B3F|nr:uncharacterized protein LOC129292198 [Prosopis cineraria]